jgi:branched-chain amino acid transport system permease protein
MRFNEMAMIVIMVIVGGIRTFPGPIVGAIFIEILSELLRTWGEMRMVLFALLVMVVARGYPAGLVGLCRTVAQRLTGWVPALGVLVAPRQMQE